jgi:hypothetical protein
MKNINPAIFEGIQRFFSVFAVNYYHFSGLSDQIFSGFNDDVNPHEQFGYCYK